MQRRIVFIVGLAAGMAACGESSGPTGGIGRFAIHPIFSTAATAGVVEIARTRISVQRSGGGLAIDTVVQVAPGADSVALVAQVALQAPSESFVLRVAFITPEGDTAFYGGPLTIQVGSDAGASPVPVNLPTVYVGVGANAAGVRILTQGAFLEANDTVTLQAEAFDSSGAPIPNTPIAWSSLDPALATVPDPAAGMVVGGTGVGQARIVAALLTGPADTLAAQVGVATGSGTVLVLSNIPNGNAAIRDSFPLYMPGFTFDTMYVGSQTPSLATLLAYRLVLLYEDGLFPNSVNVGDTVAAYVQAGGNVVIGTFYWQDRSDNQEFNGAGWGALEALDPFFGPEGSEYRPDSLHAPSVVAHPMTTGVTSLYVPSYHGGVVAKPGTTVLAYWSDACSLCSPDNQTPMVGYRIETGGQRIVGVSMAPQYAMYGGYRGDFYRLWGNVLGWAIAGGPGVAGAAPRGTAPRSHPVTPAAGPAATPRGGSRGVR